MPMFRPVPGLALGSALLGLTLLAVAAPARGQQPILDRVHARGAVACGASPRPGVADTDAAGKPIGLAVDLCRAVAIAVLGPDARIDFHLYESESAFDRVRRGEDDVSFLTDDEMAAPKSPRASFPDRRSISIRSR